MRTFDEILAIAAERKGSVEAVLGAVTPVAPQAEVAAVPDDRWLAEMKRAVFQAGFNWDVIEKKWPGFEAAFEGFDVGRCAFMPEDWFEELAADTRIVRNGKKIRAVQVNAQLIQSVEGGFGAKIAGWPREDFAGLLQWLGKGGSHMSGTSAQYMLRKMGVDGYVLGKDVVGRLIAEGVIDKPPTSQKAMQAVQGAFNEWADQSERSLKEISRVLAQSLDA
ncbi:DNA-3-methyladenine glycosylase I [Gymnodinialimonas hymeniacidonis]|uniref:DNA-3-methyladenine glycosylase I n=1 Tax=Gymnodinialimonas hymeniacidonis TaxID=3126508 RepID=UPI0034C5D725